MPTFNYRFFSITYLYRLSLIILKCKKIRRKLAGLDGFICQPTKTQFASCRGIERIRPGCRHPNIRKHCRRSLHRRYPARDCACRVPVIPTDQRADIAIIPGFTSLTLAVCPLVRHRASRDAAGCFFDALRTGILLTDASSLAIDSSLRAGRHSLCGLICRACRTATGLCGSFAKTARSRACRCGRYFFRGTSFPRVWPAFRHRVQHRSRCPAS